MNPYRALLARNRHFRLRWFGQIVSQLGNWFNSVALYALLLELTCNATSVAFLIIVQFLPTAAIGPVAGIVVDRVNRRRLMIVSALSSFVCSYALDAWKLSPFLLIVVLGALFVLPALGWLLIERRQSARYAS